MACVAAAASASVLDARMARGANLALPSRAYQGALRVRGGAAARQPLPRQPVPATPGPSAATTVPAPQSSAAHTAKVGSYFALWYILNIAYNIFNKKMLNAVPLPWTMATAQLGTGLLYILPVWLLRLRAAPQLSLDNIKGLTGITACHTAGHIMTVISLGAGAVSFTHIVKAAEPLFSTLMSAIVLKSTFPWQVYMTLLPIVAGVAIASMTELTFSWVSFLNAMGSNTAFSLRAIFSKMAMNKPQGKNMTPPNLYAVLTIMAFIGVLPLTLLVEGSKIQSAFETGIAGYVGGANKFWTHFFACGLSYYLYNEVAFLALGQVHPITHAVGNTIKRVVILIASVIAFGTKMRPMSIAGSAMAVSGTLLYSLAKSKYA
ncbi:triosephosphate/phosphate translocator [Tribonema minus]|uniref:Triosephosphate/phosphate translocator n=1 Tax=Tribonema minus TaxID=303371 RepID=A0A835ZAU1_9STRA|nr:triosephosphate/phosphate translocator [Tribonema minus]